VIVENNPALEIWKSNRRKIIYFDEMTLLDILEGKVELRDFADLPSDATPMQVFYEFHRRCWSMSIHSSEFETVEIGHMIPSFREGLATVCKRVETPREEIVRKLRDRLTNSDYMHTGRDELESVIALIDQKRI